MKKHISFLTLFIIFLIYFVWNSSWHLPSQLVIKGHVESPTDVRIDWDSGSGFNDMESANVVFGRHVDTHVKSGIIRIRRVGKGHPSAKSADVRIKVLKRSQDIHPMGLKAFSEQKGVQITAEGYLRLQSDGAVLQVPAGKKYTVFCFDANENAGIVEIDLDGDKRLYDLYANQQQDKWVERKRDIFTQGNFTVTVNLPCYDINRLKIYSIEALQAFRLESVMIVSKKGNESLPLSGRGLYSSIGFSDLSRNTRQYFHPVHFLQQVLFALLSAWLAIAVFRFIRSRGGIIPVLSSKKRPIFWLMFAGGSMAFCSWLLVYWPGHFTTDSGHIWWAAKQPGYFLHDHPVMNVIYYRFLQQFWDHFAVVAIAQIFFMSLLGSYIFYWLHKKGVSLFIILPFYLLFITSIPIGLYTITLWKDIPFAIVVVFWAFWLVKLGFEKSEAGVRLSRMEIIILSLLLILLGLFRYNGIVYFVIIPVGLALLGIIPYKKFLIGSIGMLILAAFIFSITIKMDKNNYIMNQSRFFIERMMSFGAGETVLRVIKQYPTILDINVIKKRKIWYDTWYRDSGVTKWHYDFTRKKEYNQWISYMPCDPKSNRLHELLHPLNLKSTKEPFVYFTWNPFYMLFIFPICFLYRLFPSTAAFSYVVLSQVIVLLWVLGPYNYNWRYYYFLYVSLYFLIPVIALDSQFLRHRFKNREREGEKGRLLACRKSA